MPLVTHVRCKHCGVSQTVIGPSAIATYEQPDWQIDFGEFYNPNGHHYCSMHAQRNWILFCEDPDHDWVAGDEAVSAFRSLSGPEVVKQFKDWKCKQGHRLFGIEDPATNELFYNED